MYVPFDQTIKKYELNKAPNSLFSIAINSLYWEELTFDPFLLIAFLTIFSFKLDLKKVYYKKNYLFIFGYFLVFLIISNLKLILLV